ncbi:cohesin subunit IRR1 [Rhodotorula paludigena]|uniref:cohesin subunit IRR1 n=1 Tax=Rhodotorula paludigena TaxID=86838 RepID=UPI0031814BAE
MASSDSGASDRSSSSAPDREDAGSSRADRASAGRRKSGRARKEIQRLDPSSAKAKAAAFSGSSDDDDDDDDSADEEFKVPTSIKTGSRKRAPAGTSAGATSRTRKPRAAGTGARKPAGAGPRRKKADADGEEDGSPAAAKAGKDFKIEDNNELFNAVKNPNTALQQTAEDWIESYKESSGPAMSELVNFVLRCCGCNAVVDEHQAEDENGIVENLKDIVDEFKREADLAYPLMSKSKAYKKFRPSLAQFLQKLLVASADDLLFSTSFNEHFSAWVHALSSSQIRALRHTATVISLLCVNALSTLHVQVRKEHAQAVRAKEAEEKKSRKDKARLRDMERQVKEAHERLEAVEGFMEESYTSVFVNRYRDADSVIRAECISALGSWMKLDPDYWIDGDYLRYIGWVLSDESKEARRESVRALFSLYQKDAYLGKLHHFTDRFKQQLVDMAVGEHDLPVRIQALQVVRQIDAHGLLEDDKQRDEIALLVFEKERRVRFAAADFFKGLVDEQVDERKGELDLADGAARGKKVKEQERALATAVEYKVLAELLVKYGRMLDGGAAGPDSAEDEEDDSQRRSQASASDELSAGDLVPDRAGADADGAEADTRASVPRGRVAFAVEALWDSVDALRDWEGMLEYVLRDHSGRAVGEEGAAANGKAKAKGKGRAAKGRGKKGAQANGTEEDEAEGEGKADDEVDQLPEELRLSEDEETLFIEVLVACLTRITVATATTKKGKEQEDETHADVSRAVIEALPKLFSKNQTFPTRIVDILAIPRLISLDQYLDLQQVSAFEALWDDVTKQFLKHTQANLLDEAARTLVHFLAAQTLSATNTAKLGELEESLVATLRETAGEDVEGASYGEDELHALTACVARLEKLARVRNISACLEDTDGGKAKTALDILEEIVNRGRLGYKEEAAMVEHAIQVLGTHLVWQLQAVAVETVQAETADLPAIISVSERRRSLLDKLEEYAVGNETNAAEGVKQVSLAFLLDIHTISRQLTSPQFDPSKLLDDLKLVANEQLQARCAGYIEAELERYAEVLADEADEEKDETQREADSEDADSGSETETEGRSQSQRGKKGKGKKKAPAKKGKKAAPKKQDKRRRKTAAQIRSDNAKQQARLLAAQRFERMLAPFVRAIHCGALDLQHSAVLLKHWGRLGPACDEQAKLLMHDLRDEGNYGSASDTVAAIVVDALKGACELYIDAPDTPSVSEEPLVSLGRHLVSVVIVRGAHLAVVDALPAEDHLRIHLDALKWIVQKLSQFEDNKRKDDRNRALSFFKALAYLLLSLDGRSALKIKTTLDSLLDEHHLEVPETSKTWDPVRAYQRRLITVMSKDPAIQKAAKTDRGAAGKKKAPARKGKAKSTSDVEDEDELEDDEMQVDAEDDDETPDSSAPQQRTGSKRRAAAPPQPSLELYGSQAQRPPASTADESGSPSKRRRVEGPADEPADEDDGDDAVDALLAGTQVDDQPAAESGDISLDLGLGDASSPAPSSSAQKKRARAGDDELETGDLGETQAQPAGADEDERPEFERDESVASELSLSDFQKKRRRL